MRLQLAGGELWGWCVPGPQRGEASPAEKSMGCSGECSTSGEALRAGFIYPGGDKIRGYLITVYH